MWENMKTMCTLLGWTMSSADRYCGRFIRDSPAAERCKNLDNVDVASGKRKAL